jgi:hypothetical protein
VVPAGVVNWNQPLQFDIPVGAVSGWGPCCTRKPLTSDQVRGREAGEPTRLPVTTFDSWAEANFVLVTLAPVRMAPARLDPVKSRPARFAEVKSQPEKSAFVRTAPGVEI